MHFSYAGITCYYAILVGESLAANSDRAKARASSPSRQPFKGQLNASLAQGGSTKAVKNNLTPSKLRNLSSALYCNPRGFCFHFDFEDTDDDTDITDTDIKDTQLDALAAADLS